MNPDNVVHLIGCVALVEPTENWTRYKPGGRGQVRFWLAVSRTFAGDGVDVVLCAIEPRTADEIKFYEEELKAKRTVTLTAEARSTGMQSNEASPGVIFVAQECGFDTAPVHDAHRLRKLHATGKMAAAGEHLQEGELPLASPP